MSKTFAKREVIYDDRHKDGDWCKVYNFLAATAAQEKVMARFGGEDIPLCKGELLADRKFISQITNVEESKVYRILTDLTERGEIEQKPSNKNTLIKLKDGIFEISKDKRPKFDKPTPEEVEAYARSLGYRFDGARFCDYYDSNGWLVGKNPMKCWKSTVRNWLRREPKTVSQQLSERAK